MKLIPLLAQFSAAEPADFIPMAIFAGVIVSIVIGYQLLKRWRTGIRSGSRCVDMTAPSFSQQTGSTAPQTQIPIANVSDLDPDVRQSVTAVMRQHSDETLQRIVTLEQLDYQPAAIQIAKDELRRRGLTICSQDEYWQKYAADGCDSTGFCQTCYHQTTAESPDKFDTMEILRVVPFLRFIRPQLLGEEERCGKCNSVVKGLWISLLLPVVCLARYRVIVSTEDKNSFVARRIKDEGGSV